MSSKSTNWVALPRLWKKLHVEAGWEAGARIGAARAACTRCEVSNLDWVKAFATDAPPAKLAFYAPPPPAGAAALSRARQRRDVAAFCRSRSAHRRSGQPRRC